MNLRIKLENSNYCDGCPLISHYPDVSNYGFICNKGYFVAVLDTNTVDEKFCIRPKECIKENGK